MLKLTYYLDVVSSWCFYAEDTWAELKEFYEDLATFEWKVSLIPPAGLPKSREEEEYYYRRSGTTVRWQTMLNGAWLNPEVEEYLVPNAVAEAGKDFGITDDRIRLALAHAAMVEGQSIWDWKVAAGAAVTAVDLDQEALLETARSQEIEDRVRASTQAFDNLQVNQRPTFIIEDEIGDRAVFSGLIHLDPLVSTIESMIEDCQAYRAYHAHHGEWPA